MESENIAARKQEILDLTHKFIEVVNNGDYETYKKMTASDLTCFEPQSLGHQVTGMPFHQFYFEHGGLGQPKINTTILSPIVHLLGEDGAIISYMRLTQFIDSQGIPHTRHFEETRVYRRNSTDDTEYNWHMVHLHRSSTSSETGGPTGQF